MLGSLVHRGPDDEGRFVEGDFCLGHRRLSIIDLDTGHQPIHNEDETLWIVYNGEVYNYRELREELEAMRTLLAFAYLGFLGLTACAGLPGPESSRFSASPPKPGHAAVYIGRPRGWNVSYIPLSVELDGQALAQLGINTYTRIELAPGSYKLAAADTYLTKVTYGAPRPLQVKVEAGRSYFVLPTRSVENVRPAVQVVGTVVVPTKTGDVFGGFAVQADAAPSEFAQLSYVAPESIP